MLIRSMTTLVPVGGSGPAGDRVNSRTNVPSIQVWHAAVLPSATMMPRVIFRSSKAARIDAKYAASTTPLRDWQHQPPHPPTRRCR